MASYSTCPFQLFICIQCKCGVRSLARHTDDYKDHVRLPVHVANMFVKQFEPHSSPGQLLPQGVCGLSPINQIARLEVIEGFACPVCPFASTDGKDQVSKHFKVAHADLYSQGELKQLI